MLHSHVLNRGGLGVRSPIDQLADQNAALQIRLQAIASSRFMGATVEVQYLLARIPKAVLARKSFLSKIEVWTY